MVEAFIVGLHVAQTGIVIGINKGQMNLKAEETRACEGGNPGEEPA